MPIKAAGKLRIAPQFDIGELGGQAEDVFYTWRWYHSAPALALWLILALAIVAVKANRNWRALLVLIPLLALTQLWRIFNDIMGFQPSDREVFDMIVTSFVVGITVLWLLSHKIGGRNRLVTFLLAMAIMAAISLIGAASYGLIEGSEETVLCIALTLLLSLTVLLSTALAAMLCTRRFTGPRFVLWQCLWVLVLSVVLIFQLFAAVSLFVSPPEFTVEVFFQVMIAGVVCALLVCVMTLPYMILAISCSLFRERLRGCLKLRSMNSTLTSEAAADAPEQSKDSEPPPNDTPG